MTKYQFIADLTNLYYFETILTASWVLPEKDREKIAEMFNDFRETIFNKFPETRYFSATPEKYYNYLISAGIGKKTAAFFLNKTSQKQLSIAAKKYVKTLDLNVFNDWKKIFAMPWREKLVKTYNETNLSDKFCRQHCSLTK